MLQYLLKFSISVAVLYIFYRAVLRPLTFYQCNRFYLLCYSLLSFVIPFINITPLVVRGTEHSGELVNIIPAIENYTVIAIGNKTATTASSFLHTITWNQWLLVLFCLGAVIMLVRIIYQYLSLSRIRRQSVLLNSSNRVQLYQTSAPVSPFSFGNAIYFNSSLHNEEELQRIIQHEFVHVKQKHSIDILIGELLCIINWFNPFAWLIRNAIRQNLEFIADNDVLRNGLDKKEYQYLLLKVVGISQYSIANNFNFSSLKKRITMMNKMKSAKLHLTKFLFVLPLMAVLLLAFRNSKEDKTNKKLLQNNLTKVSNVKIVSSSDTIPSSPILPPPPLATGVDLPAPTPPPALPANVSGISIRSNIDLKKHLKEKIATVTLRNGTKEVYNLNNADEKTAYIKKYGELPKPVPPVEPVPPVTDLKTISPIAPLPSLQATPHVNAVRSVKLTGPEAANVENMSTHQDINNKTGVNIYTAAVTLKDGTIENYNLNDPKEKADFIKKYGEIPTNMPPPPVPPVDVVSPDITVNGIPVNTDASQYRQPDNVIPGNIKMKNPHNGIGSLLIIIDGVAMPEGYDLNTLNANDIERMEIIKEKDVLSNKNIIGIYGERVKKGVILIYTKHDEIKKKNETVNDPVSFHFDYWAGSISTKNNETIVNGSFSFTILTNTPLIIVDGNELTGAKSYKADNGRYRILSLNTHAAMIKYGDKAKYGALEITKLGDTEEIKKI